MIEQQWQKTKNKNNDLEVQTMVDIKRLKKTSAKEANRVIFLINIT